MIIPDKREKCIVYPFYLKFCVTLTDAAVFHKTSMGAVLLRLANVPKVLILVDFFSCIGMSAFFRSPFTCGYDSTGRDFSRTEMKAKAQLMIYAVM